MGAGEDTGYAEAERGDNMSDKITIGRKDLGDLLERAVDLDTTQQVLDYIFEHHVKPSYLPIPPNSEYFVIVHGQLGFMISGRPKAIWLDEPQTPHLKKMIALVAVYEWHKASPHDDAGYAIDAWTKWGSI